MLSMRRPFEEEELEKEELEKEELRAGAEVRGGMLPYL